MRSLLIILLLLCGCSHTNEPQSEEVQSVKCTTARLLKYQQRDFAALTTADDAVNLAFKISGRIIDIPIAKGLPAIVGTSLSFRKLKAQSYLETACYVLMGLTIIVAFKPFYECCGLEIVLWVVGEGIAYIVGAVLYSFKKIPYIHSVFHLFVILGDICHMIATWKILQMFVL